ncbi:MAG: ATP-grasp domain-containing protein [Myxococcales bacterium]|nr:ATP-grasp domain-containing protein [Myxococcales bacterium]MDD9964831.1 ATP-grasp domain-containing protein [Myxococcales bacterium]
MIAAAAEFGDAPVIIKDYVKSRKHEWEEACFVPCAADRDALRRVAVTFVERQGDLLAGGVVVREFRELESIGTHPKSGMPLTREHRVFVLDGEPVAVGRYWTDGEYANEDVPLGGFAGTMKAVKSRFFTMDLARQADGDWCIIELGDGQVAGLLDTIPEAEFFAGLASALGVSD